MAYMFMTGAGFDHRAMETWDPNDGETAVILQSGVQAPTAVSPYPKVLKRWHEMSGVIRGFVRVPCCGVTRPRSRLHDLRAT